MALMRVGIGQSRGVDAHLVRARFEYLLRVARRANPSADAKRNKQLTRCAPHCVEQRLPALMRGRNVQQHNFVRALARMARGLRRRIARVHKVDKLHAFDDTARRARRGRR